ncbi:MAG TPA: HAMP domain-containing sensor histidine kinase, partial [Cyclobacteriaceae bacterium]
QDKLFNMFYRGTASSSGSGLGLYIAREAMQKLDGKISVESTWGEGSVFRIQLPVIQNQ